MHARPFDCPTTGYGKSNREPIVAPISNLKVPSCFIFKWASFWCWEYFCTVPARVLITAFLPFLATDWRHHKPPLRGGQCSDKEDMPCKVGARAACTRRMRFACWCVELPTHQASRKHASCATGMPGASVLASAAAGGPARRGRRAAVRATAMIGRSTRL